MSDTRDQILDIVKKFFIADKDFNLSDSDSFIEAGILDSLGMMELVSDLEKTFSIKMDIDDLIPENFDSIEALTGFVESKKNKALL